MSEPTQQTEYDLTETLRTAIAQEFAAQFQAFQQYLLGLQQEYAAKFLEACKLVEERGQLEGKLIEDRSKMECEIIDQHGRLAVQAVQGRLNEIVSALRAERNGKV